MEEEDVQILSSEGTSPAPTSDIEDVTPITGAGDAPSSGAGFFSPPRPTRVSQIRIDDYPPGSVITSMSPLSITPPMQQSGIAGTLFLKYWLPRYYYLRVDSIIFLLFSF